MRRRFLSALVLCSLFLVSATSFAQLRAWKFGVGLNGSVSQLQSDLRTNDLGFGASVGYTLSVAEHVGIRGSFGLNSFTGKDALGNEYRSNPFSAKFFLSYDILPESQWNPFIFAGGGVYYVSATRNDTEFLIGANDQPWDILFAGGAGIDIFPDPLWSITISAEGTLMGKDKIEGVRGGSSKDVYSQVNIGFRYYFYDTLFFLNQQVSPSDSN
ncbi:MAG: porin family protein [Nitrososphaera sp.]|nr:porin family protein [Nitrososphaera sp.]MCI0706131.1 porin family protein [Ignavibacteriota bacterium]